jgi:hypothetical protein
VSNRFLPLLFIVLTGMLHGQQTTQTNCNLNGNTANCTSTTTDTGAIAAERQRENYEAGYVIGYTLASAITEGLRARSFCKANPTGSYERADGVFIACPKKPLDSTEQQWADDYCREHPGGWFTLGKRDVDCLTPPTPLNLKWSKWEMNRLRKDYQQSPASPDVILSLWLSWLRPYCSLAGSGAAYKDLNGKRQTCP